LDPVVAVCTGKDCRRTDGHDALVRTLGAAADVAEVGCLDICHGTVVVVRPADNDALVVERLRSRKAAVDLVEHVVHGGRLSGRLRKRRVTGPAARTARNRAARAVRG